MGAEGEIMQGKLLVDAAKATGVKHFVWSTLDSTPYKASHWESKDVVDKYLRASGVPRTSCVMLGIFNGAAVVLISSPTRLYTSCYFENYLTLMVLRKRDDGSYDFPMPLITDAPIAMYSVADTGQLQ